MLSNRCLKLAVRAGRCSNMYFSSFVPRYVIPNRRDPVIFTLQCFSTKKENNRSSQVKSEEDCDEDFEIDVGTIQNLLPRSLRVSGMPHNVFVIQPFIKWGPDKNRSTTPQLQLDEASTLIRTLPSWTVEDTKIVSLLSFDKMSLFNKGQLQEITDIVRRNHKISALYINIKTLRTSQHLYLEELFKVPVYDRYSVIMNIFKHHAKSKEAKLQVSLAEIPYLRSRLLGINEDSSDKLNTESSISPETKKDMLAEREQNIKNKIKKLRQNRQLMRSKRKDLKIPVVAVVGYTNAGKTSLIKILTSETSMKPKDQLFATLDVTVHAGYLPRNLKVLFADTIGFVSDIPSKLMEPFIATLEDAMLADVIVVVMDVSHPDYKRHFEVVMSTLRDFKLDPDIMNNIILVDNKCDKISSNSSTGEDHIMGTNENSSESNAASKHSIENKTSNEALKISCLQGTGIDELREIIEEAVIKTTGLRKLTFRVLSGGLEFTWILRETAAYSIDVDPKDPQYCYISVLISEPTLNIFKSKFIKK